MSELPTTFKADLRHTIGYKDIDQSKWFQWSTTHMIEMGPLDTYRFVKGMIPHPQQKILEVGCGNGYLSLELARDGHDVTGIDISQEIIEVAERTKTDNPDKTGFGKLNYICGDVNKWQVADASFDIVIFNLSLHHLSELQQALTQVKSLLKSGGRIICHDYAYDRLDDKTACWMYQMQRLLFLSGLYDEYPKAMPGDIQSIEALRNAWLERSLQHGLNRYADMAMALQTTFQEQFFAWVPYLFIYIANGIRNVPPEKEGELIAFLKSMEKYMIEKEYIQAVGFRYVGSV